MIYNPFTSLIYDQIWSKHFNSAKASVSFGFITNVSFVKHWLLPLYVNVGKNLTKGIYYEIDSNRADYKRKTFVIYDVPAYFNVVDFVPNSDDTLRLKKLYQYQGFLMDLTSYQNQDEYIKAQFSSKNRREFRSNIRRLETCFDITYEFIHGKTAREEFDVVFVQFYKLLKRRFLNKQTNYHHLSPKKWHFYKDLVFDMLQEKRASLLVIKNGLDPIGITLNFHSDDILFETITVFDPDYYKFSIGKTSIIKLLEWCFENDYKISDFSKGDFEYKQKWANKTYDFHYHIFFDKSSLKSRLTASLVEVYFKAILFMREKNVNSLYRKFVYRIKGDKGERGDNFTSEIISDFKSHNDFDIIDIQNDKYHYILQSLYVFLFANPENIHNITVYKNKNNPNVFIFAGNKVLQKVKFN